MADSGQGSGSKADGSGRNDGRNNDRKSGQPGSSPGGKKPPANSNKQTGGDRSEGSRGNPPRRTGGLNLRRVGGDHFELIHPRCVQEMELDYEEGIELRKAGDPEAARDALRYALQGCGDNIWVHNALGAIALDEFNDPTLARGHYGYAFELANKALPPGFEGRLSKEKGVNRPFFEAIEGLAKCYDALGDANEARYLRLFAAKLIAGSSYREPTKPPFGKKGN